jgi:hypothetical protein
LLDNVRRLGAKQDRRKGRKGNEPPRGHIGLMISLPLGGGGGDTKWHLTLGSNQKKIQS